MGGGLGGWGTAGVHGGGVGNEGKGGGRMSGGWGGGEDEGTLPFQYLSLPILYISSSGGLSYTSGNVNMCHKYLTIEYRPPLVQ